MDDYISREEARKAFLKALSKNGDREKSAIDWHNCKVILGSIPAADVRPVVRGMWIDKWFCSNMTGYEYAMKCSNCGKPTYRISIVQPMPNFCPSCGADMREVQGDG